MGAKGRWASVLDDVIGALANSNRVFPRKWRHYLERAGDREFGKAERETERREERVFKGGEMGCGRI